MEIDFKESFYWFQRAFNQVLSAVPEGSTGDINICLSNHWEHLKQEKNIRLQREQNTWILQEGWMPHAVFCTVQMMVCCANELRLKVGRQEEQHRETKPYITESLTTTFPAVPYLGQRVSPESGEHRCMLVRLRMSCQPCHLRFFNSHLLSACLLWSIGVLRRSWD